MALGYTTHIPRGTPVPLTSVFPQVVNSPYPYWYLSFEQPAAPIVVSGGLLWEPHGYPVYSFEEGGLRFPSISGGSIFVPNDYPDNHVGLGGAVLQYRPCPPRSDGTGFDCFGTNVIDGGVDLILDPPCADVVDSGTLDLRSDPLRPNVISNVFRPAGNYTIAEAATLCGYDHFNWMSVISSFTIKPRLPDGTFGFPLPFTEQNCNLYGNPVHCEFLHQPEGGPAYIWPSWPNFDPALGGFKYFEVVPDLQGCGDASPYYYLEIAIFPKCPLGHWSAHIIDSGAGFEFFDKPVQASGVEIDFVTSLVGVKGGHRTVVPNKIFRWHYEGATAGGTVSTFSIPSASTVGTVTYLGLQPISSLPAIERSALRGERISDVFWRNVDGSNAVWEFVGSTPIDITATFLPGVPHEWHADTIRDIDGDGNLDVVWFHPSTGQVAIWLMASPRVVKGVTFPANVGAGSGWTLAGAGDVNGDGRADLLWRNAASGQFFVWYMNVSGTLASVRNYGNVPLEYALRGVADFDGDGVADLLWFRATDGLVAQWLMKPDGSFEGGYPGAVGPASWHPVGVGDFDGDGKGDILWRNEADGTPAVWYLNGAVVADFDFFIAVPLATWELGSIGDFDLQGRSDLMWHGTSSGAVFRWRMQARHVSPIVEALPAVGTSWVMVQ